MSYSLGFLLLLLNIFLPGLVFLRFYFIGQFSKQFTTKVPLFRIAFYSLIPGLILQIFAFSLCRSFGWIECDFHNVLIIYRDLLSNDVESYKSVTENFVKNGIGVYVVYSICVIVLAITISVFSQWFIRKSKLDINFKLLRFQNQWHYIFSGEVKKFKKFNFVSSKSDLVSKNPKNSMMSYVNILTEEQGKAYLYKGFVIDYDLDSVNPNILDKIYLVDAKKKENKRSKSFSSIPGSVFILLYNQVINLNITYVPSIKELNTGTLETGIGENTSDSIHNYKEKITAFFRTIAVGMFLVICLQIIFQIFPISVLNDPLEHLHWFQKYLIIGLLANVLTYFLLDNSELNPRFKKFGLWVFLILNGLSILYEVFTHIDNF